MPDNISGGARTAVEGSKARDVARLVGSRAAGIGAVRRSYPPKAARVELLGLNGWIDPIADIRPPDLGGPKASAAAVGAVQLSASCGREATE
jgi:hypothetical protein